MDNDFDFDIDFDFTGGLGIASMNLPVGADPIARAKELYLAPYAAGNRPNMSIECQGRIFPVHSFVICAKCEWFARCMATDMVEKREGVVHMPDDDPNAVARLIEYLYTGDYTTSVGPGNAPIDRPAGPRTRGRPRGTRRPPPTKKVSPLAPISDGKDFLNHVLVWVIADKYLVEDLMDISAQKYKVLANETIAKAAGFESSIRNRDYKQYGFIDSIRAVYALIADNNRHLRDIVLGYAYNARSRLLELPEFDDVLLDFSALGHELLQKSATDEFRRKEDAIQVIWLCDGFVCDRYMNCKSCKSKVGGFLMPHEDYYKDPARRLKDKPREWICAEVDCETVNNTWCEPCRRNGGRFVHVDNLSPKVKKELTERVLQLKRKPLTLDPPSPPRTP